MLWQVTSVVLLFAAGCSMSGTISFDELNFKRIPTQGPLISQVPVSECFWWVDEDKIRLSLGYEEGVGLGEMNHKRLDCSFVLPEAPADRARDYQVDSQMMRCYWRRGPVHDRFSSIRGIIAIWLAPGNKLHGRFRLIAGQENFHILTGWSDVGQVVLSGEFDATHDPKRGEKIFIRSEEDGMERSLPEKRGRSGRARPKMVIGPESK